MNRVRLTYWISTGIFCSAFATTGTLYLLHHRVMVAKCVSLGYPIYLLDILGLAKVLGVLILITPRFPRLKEWAYAGFAFDFGGAVWSHVEVQGWREAITLIVPITIGTISYLTFRKLQAVDAFPAAKVPWERKPSPAI